MYEAMSALPVNVLAEFRDSQTTGVWLEGLIGAIHQGRTGWSAASQGRDSAPVAIAAADGCVEYAQMSDDDRRALDEL